MLSHGNIRTRSAEIYPIKRTLRTKFACICKHKSILMAGCIRLFNRLSTADWLIAVVSVGRVGKVSRERMFRTKSIYLTLSLLTAAFLVAGAASNQALAEEFDGWDGPAMADSQPPSLAGQNSGFALETPAEAGAHPIASPYVIPMPQPVAPFPILLNRYVRRYVSDYVNSPDHLQDTFDRSHPYLADMVRVLRSYGLPDDLVYLAFAESEFSRRGKGPWQFNSSTARRFGLRIDNYVDERRDPVMSTKAAAEYLATLHDEAGDDWPMTLVAWNRGDRAIDRFWSLRGPNMEKFGNRLPRGLGKLIARITPHKFFKGCIGILLVVQIVFVDLANPEQSVEAELAARIFAAQKFILLNRRAQCVGIVEAPSHFFGHLGGGNYAGIGAAGSGRSEINPAIGVDHAFIVHPRAFVDGLTF